MEYGKTRPSPAPAALLSNARRQHCAKPSTLRRRQRSGQRIVVAIPKQNFQLLTQSEIRWRNRCLVSGFVLGASLTYNVLLSCFRFRCDCE